MLVAEGVLGNVDDDIELVECPDGAVETVTLDDSRRRRSRVRATTDAGTEIGIVTGDEPLREGDVVYADDDRIVVVAIAECDALVIDLGDVEMPAATLASAVEFGHAIGNRHLDLSVRDEELLIPAPDSRDRVEEEVREHLPERVTVREAAVDPSLFDASGSGHGHDHHATGHDHGGDHGHHHDHADGGE